MKARIVLLVLLALVFPVQADWKRVERAGGVSVCQDTASGAQFRPPYSAKADVTKACNTLTSFLPWLGTAEAQTLTTAGLFKGQIPDNVPVGSPTNPPPTLSAPWLQADIGAPPTAGNCFDAQNILTNSGAGDIHGTTDAFHFCYQAKSGNWRIDEQILSNTGADQYRRCGPMIRNSLAVDEKYGFLNGLTNWDPRPEFLGKASTGIAETRTLQGTNWPANGYARLEIINGTITAYTSANGTSGWESRSSVTFTPAATIYIGSATSSGLSTSVSTCLTSVPVLTSLSSATAGVLDYKSATYPIREDSTPLSVCVTRTVDTMGAASVQITNAGTGSAASGTDFSGLPITLNWSGGQGGDQCGNITIINRAGSQTSRTINLALGSFTGATAGTTQQTATVTITDKDLVAIKTQPGVYAAYNKTCIPWDGVKYGCTKAELLSAVATEVCPNSYIVGLKVIGMPSFFMADTAGVYTATGPDRGFAIFDPVLDALEACGKFLVIQSIQTILVDLPSLSAQYFPKFTYDPAWNSDGTAAPGAYGIVHNTQSSQQGMTAKVWQNDWRDLAIAASTAYCNRYGSRPGFYAVGMIYWNTSLPFNSAPSGYDEATFNNQFRAYLAGARAACPTTNILATLDFANPYPAQLQAWFADIRDNTHASMANNDVFPHSCGATWAQQLLTGKTGVDVNGLPNCTGSGTDFRGVLRNMEEVEAPEMCGGYGPHAPSEFYNYWRNGAGVDLPRWPTHIVVFMSTECDPTYGWAAWKAYLATLGGATVMNGHDSTLRTPAAVKASWCESSLTCQ